MRESLAVSVGHALGVGVLNSRPLSGGSINDAYACELCDGRTVFVKSNRGRYPGMFSCEARGLAWLAQAEAVPVPVVLAVSTDQDPIGFLVLEYLAGDRRSSDFDEQLGQGLAALHRHGAEEFGLDHDNYLATLEQDNRSTDSWAEFYAHRRLEPQVQKAVDSGRAPKSWTAGFAALFARMADLVGPQEPPARLHGDLWSGNLHADAEGRPVLIDPACYGGHREVDLAMLRLFGAPGPRCFAAYNEAYPLADGHRDRVPLYQLYPLLAHVNLFGGGYVSSVDAALGQIAV